MPLPRVLFLIPPLTQLNTPYPSTAYLTGFLRSRGYEATQADLGLDMVLRLFSPAGLSEAFRRIKQAGETWPGEVRQMLALEGAYLTTIEPVIAFLQGRDPMLAPHLAGRVFYRKGLASRWTSVRDMTPLPPLPPTRPSIERRCILRT